MRILPERTVSSIILAVSLAVILAVLAVLQYRWSGQVSEAEHERMHTSLLASMNQFRLEFNDEFRQLGFLFQPDATVLLHRDWKSYASTCDALLRTSGHRLVRNIYLWVTESDGAIRLLQFNRSDKAFETASWPADFEAVRDRFNRAFSAPSRPEPESRPFMSTLAYRIPLMIQPLMAFRTPPETPPAAGERFVGYLMIELNLDALRTDLLPQLAQKYFKGQDGFIYQVAVIGGRNHDALLYRSDPHLTLASFASPDAKIELQENRFGPMMPRPGREMDGPGRRNGGPPVMEFRPETAPSNRRFRRGPPFLDEEGSGWELVTKHRKGSLEAAVTGSRRRNLAFSFGTLLLLALSAAFIIASARRAQSLARMQIDFVAGISHELRTPLSVICSAGDNLAEGIIPDEGNSARKYGELIRAEGRKLAGMIEQILKYASLQKNRRRLHLRPEPVNDIVEDALKQAQPAITAAGFSAEKNLDPELPRVFVEAAALSQAIQNLIQNALKYSGQSRWLAIRTQKAHGKRSIEVQVIVEDRGMGIASADLPHIFEPFYRGGMATAAQIHGTGLGLYIVREDLNFMGGSVSVKSALGKGSVFTIHLPALPHSKDASLRA